MRRLFWMTVGATVGIVAMRKATRTLQAFSPAGLGERLTTLGIAARVLAEEVRLGMSEREAELRGALSVPALSSAPVRPQLTSGSEVSGPVSIGRHAMRSTEGGEV
jgi:hypothetical protein